MAGRLDGELFLYFLFFFPLRSLERQLSCVIFLEMKGLMVRKRNICVSILPIQP